MSGSEVIYLSDDSDVPTEPYSRSADILAATSEFRSVSYTSISQVEGAHELNGVSIESMPSSSSCSATKFVRNQCSAVAATASSKKCDAADFSLSPETIRHRPRGPNLSTCTTISDSSPLLEEASSRVTTENRSGAENHDDECAFTGPAVKRKKKTREELEYAKLAKERERENKIRMRMESKELKERVKMEKRIQREQSASLKSKAEQYIFCHVGKSVYETIGNLDVTAKMLFMERNIENQLKCEDDLGMRVEWRRKCIEAITTDAGGISKLEYTCAQHVFAHVITSEALTELVLSNSLEDFVMDHKSQYPVANSQLILICYGQHKISPKKLSDVTLSLFESYRAQLRVVLDEKEFALFLAQMIRGLSKMVRSENVKHGGKLIIDVEKGVRDGDRSVLVRDWWDKMLAVICRIGDGQRRAILKHIPDPIAARQKFSQMEYSASVAELSEIVCENSRRVGPTLAHRVYMLLMDKSGAQLVE